MAGRRVLGRGRELAQIEAFVAGADQGFAALAIVGEAGIGKTTAWEEAVRASEARAYTVLRCRAAEQEVTLAYAGLSDLLAGSETLLPRLARPQREALEAALMLSVGDMLDQRAVGLGVLAALRLHAAERPTLVAVDDVQWLDRSTLRVLQFALRRLSREPLRLLMTLRSGSVSPLTGRGSLRVEPDELGLGPFDEATLEALLRQTLGQQLRKATLRELHEVSGGNPFFALEIAREAVRVGRHLDGGEPFPIPDDLRNLLERRLGRLDERTRDLLLVVAAASRPTSALLQDVLGGDARGYLAQALEAGVLVFDRGRLHFSHPLLASAVYAERDVGERRRVHLRLANAVDDPEERGRHLALGTDIPDAGIAAALDEAVAAARRRGATDAGALLGEHALRLTPQGDERDLERRAMRAADDLFVIGEIDRSEALVDDLAARMPAGPARARVLRRLVRARAFATGFTTTEALLRSALADAASDRPTRTLLEHDLGEALLQYGHLKEAAPHCDAAFELATTGDDDALVQRAQITRDVLRFMQGHNLPAGLEDRARALTAEDSRGRRAAEPGFFDEVQGCALMLKYADRFGFARDLLERLLQTMEAEQGEGIVAPVLFHLAEIECWMGRLDRSIEFVRELQRTLARVRQGGMRTRVAYVTALVHAHTGRLERAHRIAATHLTAANAENDVFLAIRLESLLGFIALSAAKTPSAVEHLRRASALSEAAGYGEPGVVRYAGDEIEALLEANDADAAKVSLERLEQRARRLDRLWAHAVAGRGRALLIAATGDLDSALEIACASLPLHERIAQPLERGRLLMSVGILHRRLKDRRAAREALAASRAIFDSIGASAWAARATGEADRISGRRPQPSGLTPTEQQIAELAAAGRTNKEVAAEMHLSVKAVEANLSRVYRKLAIRGRSQLMRARLPPPTP
jgi:DNA-binding CsgD family transcriptional regulator